MMAFWLDPYSGVGGREHWGLDCVDSRSLACKYNEIN